MANKFLNLTGLSHFWSKVKAQLDLKVDKVEGKGLSTNDLTNELKGNYDAAYTHSQAAHAPADAEKNIVVGVKVNGQALSIDGDRLVDVSVPTGTLAGKNEITEAELGTELAAKINASTAVNHSHDNKAVIDQIKQADLDKLAGIEEGANKYVHATHTEAAEGMYKVTVDAEGHVSKTTAIVKGDITALGIPAQDTTYEAVTTAADGLMIAADKSKLDGVAAGAQVNVLEGVKVNGAAVSATDKVVDIAVPTTVAQLTDAAEYAKKADLTNVYIYKGSVATYAELPTEGLEVGHVYNVEEEHEGESGKNFAWNGSAWDDLGGILEIEALSNEEIDTIFA